MCGPNPHLDEIESEESNTRAYEGQVWGGNGNGIEYTVRNGKLIFDTGSGNMPSAYHNGASDLSEAIANGGLTLLRDVKQPPAPEPVSRDGEKFQGVGGVIYTVKGGKLTFTNVDGQPVVSAYHTSRESLEDALATGDFSPVPQEEPKSEPDPDSQESRSNRLNAAQQDTGFDLGDEVEDVETGQKGKIVGFARVNVLDGAPGETTRKLVVRETVVEEFLLDPDDAELVEA